MRGKEEFAKAEGIRIGLTPAYAGKSHFALPNKVCIWDHPRLCGEKSCTSSRVRNGTGSPPPMRGKDVYTPSFTAVLRITPAYAGKRQITVHSVCSSQDHPRLCGEKSSMVHRPCKKTGSPPPMRGKEFYQPYEKAAVGITPAYAGKRCYNQIPCPHSRDHPRLCGEKFRIVVSTAFRSGSPPPMRGKVTVQRHAVDHGRITPAYAGKRISTTQLPLV